MEVCQGREPWTGGPKDIAPAVKIGRMNQVVRSSKLFTWQADLPIAHPRRSPKFTLHHFQLQHCAPPKFHFPTAELELSGALSIQFIPEGCSTAKIRGVRSLNLVSSIASVLS